GAPGIYILQKGGTIVPFGNPGSLIGGSEFEVAKIETSLQPGDRIFIPTDGLMEQALPDGRPFGDRRTLKVLEKTRGLPIAEVLPRIVKELDAHRAEVVQDDDITMIYLEVLAENTERA
ncbi:MAG: PP2C family protein-serine/threonine phosphatase, partial [Pseudobdellovibrionaceae bacterium]